MPRTRKRVKIICGFDNAYEFQAIVNEFLNKQTNTEVSFNVVVTENGIFHYAYIQYFEEVK